VPVGLTGGRTKIIIGFNTTVFWDMTLVLWQSSTKVSEKNSVLFFRENKPRGKSQIIGK
jgi:hypothetical protein